MTTRILVFLVFLTFASSASAARVELRDGTIVFGKIENLKEGEDLIVDTKHMDDVTIDWDAIVRIDDARPVTIQLFDGTRISGPIALDTDGLRVGGPDAPLIDMAQVFEIEELNKTIWDGFEFYTDLGMNLVRGNSTVTSINTGLGARYDGPSFETSVSSTAIVNEQVEAEDTRRATFAFDYTLKLRNNYTVSGGYTLESDEQQGLEARSTASLTGGKRFINQRRFRLTFELGAQLNVEDFEGEEPAESAEGVFGTIIRWRSASNIDLDFNMRILPNMNDSDRVRGTLDTSLSIDLWKDLDFKLTGYTRYDSQPPTSNKEYDWGTTVGLSWKYD